MTTRPDAAITRLVGRYYNENAVSGTNPGGLDESDDGSVAGHVLNFPNALADVGTVTAYVGDVVADAAQHAASAGFAANAAATTLAAQNAANDLTITQITTIKGQAQAAAASAAASAGETHWCGLATGTPNALTLTPASPITALFDGLTVRFVVTSPNTDVATLVVSALAVKPLRDPTGAALAVGTLATDQVTTATYVAVADHWRLGGGGSSISRAKLHAAVAAFF